MSNHDLQATGKETEERDRASNLRPGNIIDFTVTFEDEEGCPEISKSAKVRESICMGSQIFIYGITFKSPSGRVVESTSIEWCSNRQEWVLVESNSSVRNPCTWSKW